MSKRLLLAALLSLLCLTFGVAIHPARAVLPGSHQAGVAIGGSQAAISLARAIAAKARQQATTMCSVGLCYRGVKRALSPLGIALEGDAAWMAKEQLAHDGRFCVVPLKHLKPGDILVHGKSKAHPYGHIAVYLGNGQEASDHVQKLVLGGRYGTTVVFRARTTHTAMHAHQQTLMALSVKR